MPKEVFSARVHGGVIVMDEGVTLPEGTTVNVIADSEADGFELTAAEEADLAEAIAEVERGDVISAAELFRRLSRRG